MSEGLGAVAQLSESELRQCSVAGGRSTGYGDEEVVAHPSTPDRAGVDEFDSP